MSQREDTTLAEAQQYYHFFAIADPEGQRKILLDSTTYSIGRNLTNGIVLRSQLVSRQHAVLLRVPVPKKSSHLFRIIDGNLQGRRSKNGLLINGKHYFSHILSHGDEIVFSNDTRASYQIVNHPAEVVMPGDTDADRILQDMQRDRPHMSDTDFANCNEEALARLASFPELNPNPILEVNISGTITYLNPAAASQFPELYELGAHHPLLRDLVTSVADRQNASQAAFAREVEVNGLMFEQFIHYIPGSELIRSYLADITERKRSQEIIQYQAHHDALTGLPNRKHFSNYLANTLAEATATDERLAVVFIDLDGFKQVNDSLGHDIGDLLLKTICERLPKFLQEEDMLARWGGDEFILLIRKVTSVDRIFELAQRMLQACKQPFNCGGHELYISASMGISLYPLDGNHVDILVRNADTAMYRAKQSGGNSCQFYTST
ncbi:MAG: diguanylate cyclase [Pseudanabaena sp. CRU_2_10]|nr:diguanylate cyclase [Pseudanabaena sp. CRU_2_10]